MLVVLILAIIVFFGLFHITESPPFGFDEGWVFHMASNISQTGIDGTQFSPGNIGHASIISVGYPLIYALALWFKSFGIGVFQARMMMVAYMLGFATVSFLLLKRLYGNDIALASLFILATFPPFYSFGKSIIGEVPALFFLALSLLFFNLATNDPGKSEHSKKRLWLILAGASAGLCVVAKTSSLALIPVLFFGAFLALRKGLVNWKDIGTVAASAAIPIAAWLIANFQPGGSLTSSMSFYTNPSALTDRTATFWSNLRMFWNGAGPLYMLFLLAVWLVGISVRLKARKKICAEESMALAFSVMLTVSLLFRYWDARYLFPVQVLGIMFAPYSLYCVWLALPARWSFAGKAKLLWLGVAALGAAGLYQLSFSSYVADWYGSTRTADMAEYFSSLPASTTIFFYNAPNALAFFRGSDYYQRMAVFDRWVAGNEFAPIASAGLVDMLVLNPPMTKADEKTPLGKYAKVAEFGKIKVFKIKTI